LKITIIITAGSLLFSGAVSAVSVQEALLAANAYNAEINAARSLREAESQKKYQGFAGLLPAVSLNGAWTQSDQPDANYSAGVTRHNYSVHLNQPIFDVAKYANWRKSLAIVDLADVNYLIAQQKLIREVVLAYYDVAYLRSVLKNHQHIRAAFNIQLKMTYKALEIGDGTRLDEAEAKANYDKSTADLLAAENDLDNASTWFNQLTGLEARKISDLSLSCLTFGEPLKPEPLTRSAVANNLDVLAATLAVKTRESDTLAATANHLPTINFQANYGKNWSRANDGNDLDILFGTTAKTSDTTVGINIAVPLFAGGGHLSQNIEAAHRLVQSKDLLLNARRQAEQQTLQAASGMKNAHSRIAAYQRAIDSAQKRLAASRYGRQIGQRTLIDVFNAEKDYYQTIQDLAQAQNAWIKAFIDLSAALGSLDYSTVKSVDCKTPSAGISHHE